MKKPNYYPIDVNVIKKGDYILPELIAEIYGTKKTDAKHSLSVLKLRTFIEQSSACRGEPLLTKGEKYGIRILTDSESIEYTNTRAENGKSLIETALSKMGVIDRNLIDDDENLKLERNIEVTAKRLLAIHKSDKLLEAAQYERTVPRSSPTTEGAPK